MRRPPYHGLDGSRGSNPVVLGRKFCATCGRWRLLTDFHVSKRSASGTALYWFGSCQACSRVRKRERVGARPRKYGRLSYEETLRRHKQRHEKRWASDPEYRRRRREDWRFAKEADRRRRGVPERKFGPKSKRSAGKDMDLPIAPFREWLRAYVAEHRDPERDRVNDLPVAAYDHLALAMDVSREAAERAVYRWLNENESVRLSKADAVLTKLDSSARLYELWPELAEEAAA